SVLLLVGAGLFIRSLRNLRLLDLGLKTDNLIALNVSPTLRGYTSVRAKLFENQIAERIAALPGVANIAHHPIGLLDGNEWGSRIAVGLDPDTKTASESVRIAKAAQAPNLRHDLPRPVFCPFLQLDLAYSAVMYVQLSSPPYLAFGSIRHVVQQIDPNIPFYI